MFCGYIYKIQFPNGKHYIGLTTKSLKQRTCEHKSCAKQGDTRCLYNALRKYEMVDTLELIQIDTADTIEELCEKEIRHIKEYNSYYMDEKGYNMTYGGEGFNAGKEHGKTLKKYYEDNPEAGKKNGERLKKSYQKPGFKQKIADKKGQNKPFDVFTCDSTFVKTFTYQFEALQYLKKEHNIVSSINISHVLSGRQNSSVGFVFKYK